MPDSNSKIIIVTVYQHTHTIIYINTNIPRPDLAMLLCKGKRRSVWTPVIYPQTRKSWFWRSVIKTDMLSIGTLRNIDPGAIWQLWRYAGDKT